MRDYSDELIVIGIFVCLILFAGTPDLMDAIISGLMK
jgi:hypothetical protein